MDNIPLPPPFVGCLVCHTEGTIQRSQGRRLLGMGGEHVILTCNHCGAVALFDGDETQWRIRYRKVPASQPHAVLRLARAGWIEGEDALEISTQIFVHRGRLEQTKRGDLRWLKPARLNPPPPLMTPDEIVYLTLKPVNYCKAGAPRLLNLGVENNTLDSGTFYLTNTKLHLLGQRRDRSHRLNEIRKIEHHRQEWHIYIGSEDDLYYYQGTRQQDILDGELIAAIVEALRQQLGE